MAGLEDRRFATLHQRSSGAYRDVLPRFGEKHRIRLVEEPKSRDPLKRTKRILRISVWVLVLFEVLYLIGANAFLRTEWGKAQLNRSPEKLSLQWQSAWTVIPGLVHVREFELGGRARRARWQAGLERGRLFIWLPSLANRHLRLLSAGATGSWVAIEGLPAPETPRPEKARRGWRVSIDRLALADIERLQFNEYRLEGRGRINGSARFEVRGPMAFDLSRLDFEQARVLAGETLAAESLVLGAALDVDEVTIGEATLYDLLAGLSGELVLEAEASNLGFLTNYLRQFPWIDINGAGQLELDVAVGRGWLAPGSTLDFSGPAVSATYLGLTAIGAGDVRGRVPEGAGHVVLEAVFDTFEVERQVDGSQLLAGESLAVTVTNDSTAIDRPAEGVAVEVRLPPARVPDLAMLGPYLPESTGLALVGGEATISAELDYSAASKAGHGWLRFAGEQVVAEFDDSLIQANVVLDARFPNIELDSGTLAVDGTTLQVDEVGVHREGGVEADDWWGRATVQSGSLVRQFGAEVSGPAVISGELSAELLDTSPVTAVIQDRVPRLGWFDELLTVEDVDLVSDFRLAGPEVQLAELRITGGAKSRLELLAELDLRKGGADGVLFAAWGPLTAAVELDDQTRDWKLTRSRRWYDERSVLYRTDRSIEELETPP